ncbi:MAG: ABC transporter permease [Acetatifactor sp.]
MEKFGVYFLAQLKRIRKAFPSIITMTLLLTGCMALLASSLQQADAASEKKQKVKIGLAGDTANSYLGFGMMALQRLDSSRFAIEFIEMTEEEAKKELEAGEISGYAVIPEGFVEALDRGENVRITYATANDTAGIGAIIMNELVTVISDVVVESQNAIYGTWRLLAQQNTEGDYGKITDQLYLRFVEMFLNRTVFYRVVLLGIADNLSMISYYFVGIMILFMLLWGITGSTLFVKRDVSLSKLLKAGGQSVVSQMAAEYLAYFTLMTVNMFLMILPVEVICYLTGIQVPEWEAAPVRGIFLFLVKMLPVAALLAGLQFFLYELISDMISGILLQFLVGISLAYLSGCIFPVSFFPESVQRLVPLLPSGAALQYGTKCMQGLFPVKEMGIIILYLLLFLGLAVMVRERRIRE